MYDLQHGALAHTEQQAIYLFCAVTPLYQVKWRVQRSQTCLAPSHS